jgi:hypothetical protein
MTDASEWDLLSSNESGSDVYWPESEFGDTASIAESLGFTNCDFADELGDLTDLEVQHDGHGQSMRDDATLIGEYPSEIHTFPWTPDQQDDMAHLIPSSSPSSQAVPASSAIYSSKMVEGMTSILETAVCTIIDLLNIPQKLSEYEFVKSLLAEMEWDCEKLKDNVHTSTSIVERLNSLISKIVDCVATVTVADTDLSVENASTEAQGSHSEAEELDNTSRADSRITERQSQLAVPEWQQHPEPTDPTTSFSARRASAIIRSLRESHVNFICKCPSPCRSHPSVFSDNLSPFSKRCMKDFLLERANCRCETCSAKKGLIHQQRRNNGSEQWMTQKDVRFGDGKVSNTKQEETESSWGLVKGYLDEYEKNVEGSWEKVQRFLEEEYVGPRYENKKVSKTGNTTNLLPGGTPMGAMYWDPEKKLWKKGMMVLG